MSDNEELEEGGEVIPEWQQNLQNRLEQMEQKLNQQTQPKTEKEKTPPQNWERGIAERLLGVMEKIIPIQEAKTPEREKEGGDPPEVKTEAPATRRGFFRKKK